MRIAVVSDIHGNLAALQAVVEDLERQQVDCVVHGGDLVTTGPRPVEALDRVRELGWVGVVGNTDEMLWDASGRSRSARPHGSLAGCIISSRPWRRGRASASVRSGSAGCDASHGRCGSSGCSCCMRAPPICGERRCQMRATPS
jgi:3',5'-cyclic AMP phosphodiesterase CpdA